MRITACEHEGDATRYGLREDDGTRVTVLVKDGGYYCSRWRCGEDPARHCAHIRAVIKHRWAGTVRQEGDADALSV